MKHYKNLFINQLNTKDVDHHSQNKLLKKSLIRHINNSNQIYLKKY